METITKALKPLIRPIEGIIFDPVNARTHTQEGITNLKRSLEAFGQHKPIVVQQYKNKLICRAGNGVLQAAQELGWTEIAATIIKEDNISALGRALQDNKSSSVGSFWNDNLAPLLKELNDAEGMDILNTGFTMEELAALDSAFPDENEGEDGFIEPQSIDDITANSNTEIIVEVKSDIAEDVKIKIEQFLTEEKITFELRIK